MHKWLLLAASAMFAAGSAAAQPAQQAYSVELSMPFGTAGGRLVTAGEYLIFVNDPNVEKSFVIPRVNERRSAGVEARIALSRDQAPPRIGIHRGDGVLPLAGDRTWPDSLALSSAHTTVAVR
jgi:hypothetical protein